MSKQIFFFMHKAFVHEFDSMVILSSIPGSCGMSLKFSGKRVCNKQVVFKKEKKGCDIMGIRMRRIKIY